MEVFINDLRLNIIIGLLPHERIFAQEVVIDASFGCEDEELVVDYVKAILLIEGVLINNKFKTVEGALLKLEQEIKKTFPKILTLFLSIKKTKIIHKASVGARLERKY